MTAATGLSLPALRNDTFIARLETAKLALADADVRTAKAIADVAAAAEIYAARQKLGEEVEAQAHGIKIDALRRLGELLKEAPKNNGQIRRGSDLEPREDTPTLAEMGIDKKTSSMAQKLAALPAKDFEAVRDGHEAVGKAIAAVGGTRKEPPKTKPAADAKVRAELIDLQGKYADLLEKNAELKDAVAELADLAASAKAFEEKDEFKEMQVLRVELRSCKRTRDEFMAQNAEMKRMLAYWKKKAEGKGKK